MDGSSLITFVNCWAEFAQQKPRTVMAESRDILAECPRPTAANIAQFYRAETGAALPPPDPYFKSRPKSGRYVKLPLLVSLTMRAEPVIL